MTEYYNCQSCSKEEKKQRGCFKNKRKIVFDVDCICNGAKECSICGGIKKDNVIRSYRCPRSTLLEKTISRIVPYFYHWINSNYMEYPDKKGLYYQTKKMLNAFDVLLTIYNREEAEKKKRNGS